ncbi:MAG: deoxycytidine kinase [Bacillales bacterium]|jgi:deoxyadenosine/deoxycytidine kinase|nr:deoxycytidine kinase [Bacillales bacterium]
MTPYFPHPNILIYLEGSLDNVLDRIDIRGRQMERETPLDYWSELHSRYDNWINDFNSCPVLRVNINDYDLVKNEHSIEPIIERIGEFINLTRKYVK